MAIMSSLYPRLSNMTARAASIPILQQALQRYSKKELAEQLEVDPRTITRWEAGEVIRRRDELAIRGLLAENRTALGAAQTGDFTFIDLFAGIGGTRLGFERNGGACLFTSEYDASCQKTYRANFPDDNHPITGDIRDITGSEEWGRIPDHDVLVAGFPCQPFSIAGVSKKNSLGHAHGFACEAQGTLFFDVAKIIKEKRPHAFLLENVKNLMSHDKGNTFRVMQEVLERELGYKIHPKVIDGKGFVPQHRERIYIVGFRKDVGFRWDDFRSPPANAKTMGDILHPEDGSEEAEEGFTAGRKAKVLDKYTLSERLWAYLQDYAAKHQAKGNGFGFGLVNRNSIARTLSARYYKDGSEILVSQGPRKRPRRLTPRECARLMGFDTPESRFKIVVADTPAYKQFGNSVVVPVVSEIARLMKPYVLQLKGESKKATGLRVAA